MITIEDEYNKFISLTEVLIKIAEAQDSEIDVAANTLRLSLQKDVNWQNVKFVCFCSHNGLIATSQREIQLILDMLEELDKIQESDAVAAGNLKKISNSVAYLDELKPTFECKQTLQASTEDFIEYRSICFDIYGFSLKEIQSFFERDIQILALRREKNAIRHQENISAEEKKELLLEISKKIADVEKRFSHSTIAEPSARSESTYLNIIAALIGVMTGQHGGSKHPDIKNQAELIGILENKYKGYFGLGKRTLEEKFAKAKKHLENR